MPDQAQVGYRGGAGIVGIGERLLSDLGGDGLHLAPQRGERAREFLHCRVRGMHGNELLDLAAELHQFRAHVAEHLTAQQVHGLDGVGALVDHVDARIAHVLLEP